MKDNLFPYILMPHWPQSDQYFNSDMAAFERNKTCDLKKVAVIVFIVVLTGMGERPFTAGFLTDYFVTRSICWYHPIVPIRSRVQVGENEIGLSL